MIETWLASATTIPFGDDWYKWILYEIGVATGMMDEKAVFGVVVCMPFHEVEGPFKRPQNCECAEEPLTELIKQFIKRKPGATPPEGPIRDHVRSFLERVDGLDLGTKEQKPPEKEDRILNAIARQTEDLKGMIRSGPVQPAEEYSRIRHSSMVRILNRKVGRALRDRSSTLWYDFWDSNDMLRVQDALPSAVIGSIKRVGQSLDGKDDGQITLAMKLLLDSLSEPDVPSAARTFILEILDGQ